MPLTYIASGDPNQYTILSNSRWLAAVQFNGELPVGQQETFMGVIVSSLGEAIAQQTQKAAVVAPEPSDDDGDTWRTYDGWADEGYHVRRGEKSHRRINGAPVFSSGQVNGNNYEDDANDRDWP